MFSTSQLWWLNTGFSLEIHGFSPRCLGVTGMVDKVTIEHNFSEVCMVVLP